MKKIFIALFILTLSSCQKEQQPSIIGDWREVSVYSISSNGQLDWQPSSGFPLNLSLTADGTYAAFNDVPAGKGVYSYDYSRKRLQFESSTTISIETYSVSHLDESCLIIDYSADYKVRFVRL